MSYYSQELNEWVENTWDKNTPCRDPMIAQLRSETSWIDESFPTRHRMFIVKNGITKENLPVCSCGNPVRIDSYNGKVSDVCGPVCASHRKRLALEIHEKLNDKDWLYEQRVTLMKGIETIGKELGCSEQPIAKALKLSGIKFDSRQRNVSGTKLLANYDWVFQKYVTERLTMQEIAEQIKSTKSTVQIAITRHGIESRNPNDYDNHFIKTSKPQMEICNFINELGFQTEYNVRSAIKDDHGKVLELDILVPNKNLAIEYNGLHYHGERTVLGGKGKDRKYHLNKTIACEKKDILLLHIFSDEWEQKKNIIKSIISNKLGVSTTKIPARKCEVKEIGVDEKNQFLEVNHLQGSDKAKIKLGLFYGSDLVAVMTFAAARFRKDVLWELSRYAVKMNCNVIGGFSKLISYAYKSNLIQGSIVSYSDRRYSVGNVYLHNGFSLDRINPPTYYYINLKCLTQRLNRMFFQKKNFDLSKYEGMGEKEIAESLGYTRVWNCGTMTWILSPLVPP